MKITYSPLYSALLTFPKFSQDENSIQLLHNFEWLHIWKSIQISARDDRLKIHIVLNWVSLFYSLSYMHLKATEEYTNKIFWTKRFLIGWEVTSVSELYIPSFFRVENIL